MQRGDAYQPICLYAWFLLSYVLEHSLPAAFPFALRDESMVSASFEVVYLFQMVVIVVLVVIVGTRYRVHGFVRRRSEEDVVHDDNGLRFAPFQMAAADCSADREETEEARQQAVEMVGL